MNSDQRPPEPTPEQAAAVDAVARFVVRFGMTVPAVLAIESMRPLTFVGSQFMHMMSPSVGAILAPQHWGALASLLEHRAGVEVLLRRIEELDEARGQTPAERPTGLAGTEETA